MGTLFTFTGRRKRLSYFLLSLVVGVANFAANFIVGIVTGIGMAVTQMDGMAAAGPNPAALFVTLVVSIPFIWVGLALGAQRLHDMGYSGWLQILFFIPLVNLIFWLVLLFAPSQKMDNKHGPYTEENYTPSAGDFASA